LRGLPAHLNTMLHILGWDSMPGLVLAGRPGQNAIRPGLNGAGPAQQLDRGVPGVARVSAHGCHPACGRLR
jgi:hypothetical protein